MGEGEGGEEAESKGDRIKRRTVSFYQDNEAKEADVKGEYSPNGKKSISKSMAAGTPRQGLASASPTASEPQQGSSCRTLVQQQSGQTLITELNMC